MYANEFVGAVSGTADSANTILVGSRSTNASHYLTFVDSDN